MADTLPDAAPRTIHLADYRPYPWIVEGVELTFRLAPRGTRVLSRIRFAPNPEAEPGPFFLHGEDLRLVSARIDGAEVSPDVTGEGLTCEVPTGAFTWEAEVEIDPEANTRLEGLYLSNGIYCTQCEAEGFRRITYYPDRPDVMATFRVTVESDLPVLLSNGNPAGPGTWDDPWPKPSYLFALVAGDLVAHRDAFTTMSGRPVDLAIWTREADAGKAAWAMEALKLSMKWDEDAYGREYDLDVFNVVAVADFNMGAMENKGLNVFNSALVLASPETATDGDYESIERVIAHEYFHNWTGNRVTCRDWFQLSLKEGLTVFRDQQFTGDMRGHGVKRIDDAALMRGVQFREDAGPLAHPVRPESFVEINNFYTVTVYEKGAEVIGMLRRLVGEEGYAKALDRYFEANDGRAATVEDWLEAFESTTGRDLAQFKRWYRQAGTPRLHVSEAWEDGRYTLSFRQETPPTPGQPAKEPFVIPVAVGLLNPNGDEVLPTTMLEVTEGEQSFTFENLSARPVPSILRDFSAPVIVVRDRPEGEAAFLLAHDTDQFNRWDANRSLMQAALLALLRGQAVPGGWMEALRETLRDGTLDPAFRETLLSMPSQAETAQAVWDGGSTVDPLAIHDAYEALQDHMAQGLSDLLPALHALGDVPGPYSADAGSIGRRALGNAALGLLTRRDRGLAAERQFASARDMTQSLNGLAALLNIGKGEEQLAAFHARWRHEPLVLDKWFSVQLSNARPDAGVELVRRLVAHEDFDARNPNRLRAVLGSFGRNAAAFHSPDGEGYRFMGDWLLRLDGQNPIMASRFSTLFDTWRRLEPGRRALAEAELRRVQGEAKSRDLLEMVGRLLEDAPA